MNALACVGGSSIRARKHNPLPPFDASDGGGVVYTTPPPELVIPSSPDLMFMRADFTGVKLDVSRWGSPPILVGANTAVPSMLMTPMLPMYPRKWQDASLTEHAERGYSHFVVTSGGWNFSANGYNPSPSDVVSWCKYVQSWGFKVVMWPPDPIFNDAFLIAGMNAHAVDWYIAGEEVDSKLPAGDFGRVLDNVLAITGGGIPVGAHTTANFPDGFPRDTFFDGRTMPGFSYYNGKVHFMWQANQNESAGTQGARLYYARERVNIGGVSGDGREALDSRVYAFETMATNQLYGQCTEEYGNLRSLELLYTTRTDSRIRPVSGFGNGCRLPDGTPI